MSSSGYGNENSKIFLYEEVIWNGTFFIKDFLNGSRYWVSGNFIFLNGGDAVALIPLDHETRTVCAWCLLLLFLLRVGVWCGCVCVCVVCVCVCVCVVVLCLSYQLQYQDAVNQLYLLVDGRLVDNATYPNSTVDQFWNDGTYGLDGDYYIVRYVSLQHSF